MERSMRIVAFLVVLVLASAASGQEQLVPAPYLAAKYVAPQNAPSSVVIAGKNEPGERLVVTGRTLDDGTPVAGVSIYAFHSDVNGLYAAKDMNPREAELSPRLYGAMRTDANGRFRYETIRPGSYNNNAAHVHYIVTAPGYKPRMFDLWFQDDAILAARRAIGQPEVPPALQGDYLAIRPVMRDATGVSHVTHDLAMLKE
jgi:protocatechuate 3,4-dioxygenase beta subunit